MSSAPVAELPTRRARPLDLAPDGDLARHIAAERVRIARELHDIVAYGFAAITIQAGAALQLLEGRPEQAAEALQAIKRASQEAGRELRAVLGMLRSSEEDPAFEVRGLAGLDVLAATTSAAGVPTEVVLSGHQQPLSSSVELAAYRIVQESLANVLRHAGRASARVSIAYGADRVVVEVEDDGGGSRPIHGEASPGCGHGIVGMRERALALGGSLAAGPRPEGGFRVCAYLPLAARP
jgi:signal transduction histidine kinase